MGVRIRTLFAATAAAALLAASVLPSLHPAAAAHGEACASPCLVSDTASDHAHAPGHDPACAVCLTRVNGKSLTPTPVSTAQAVDAGTNVRLEPAAVHSRPDPGVADADPRAPPAA